MSFAPPKVKSISRPSISKSESSIQKDSISAKLSIIQNSVKHTSEDMEKLQVLSTLLVQETEILDLESRLSSEIAKIKDLESKVLLQNSELQRLIEITDCNDLSLVFPGEFNDKSQENKEVTIQKCKIECKEEIIKVLKSGIKELYEIKSEFNKEFNEIRSEIGEVCPGILHLTLEQELEILEGGGAEWLKQELKESIECIYQEFSSDIEKKFQECKQEFLNQVSCLRNSMSELRDETGLISVRSI